MVRKPTTKSLEPPTLGQDAAERKRVLNVLAQRRYRRRKRERMQALEAGAKDPTVTQFHSMTVDETTKSSATNNTRIVPVTTTCDPELNLTSSSNLLADPEPNSTLSLPIFDLPSSSTDSSVEEPTGLDMAEPWAVSDAITNRLWSFEAMDADLETELHNLGDLNKQFGNGFTSFQGSDTFNISEELQADDTAFFTFPDDHTLEVPSLTLLNAAMRVAQQLNVSDIIWDMTAISPFYQGLHHSDSDSSLSPPSLDSGLSTSRPSPTNSSLQMDPNELPLHLQPTRTQRLIAHHPLLDLLPWPSTRDKMIQVFNLPVHMRPSNAQDPMGLVRFVYDMEDESGEGVLVTGQNPFEPGTWEIGQLLFEKWWWAFDTAVVESSNRSRKNRGKAKLVIRG